jgi:hypothetical protein
MNSPNAILSILGVGGAASATIYAAAVTLENNVRDEFRTSLGEFIRGQNRITGTEVAVELIHHAFNHVFGSKHFSWRCVRRSALVSFLIWCLLSISFYSKYPDYRNWVHNDLVGMMNRNSAPLALLALLITVFIISCIPDYISLMKGRVVLRVMHKFPTFHGVGVLLLLDIFASLLVSYAFIWAFAFVADAEVSPTQLVMTMTDGFGILAGYKPDVPNHTVAITFVLTTLMTSIWAALTILALVVVKALMGLGRVVKVMNRVFDIDAHPVRVLGLIAAGIAWTGSLVYGLI